MFLHRNECKHIWVSFGGKTHNQIDNVLTDKDGTEM